MQLKIKRAALMLSLALATSACATAYGELGGLLDDGVAADQLSRDTFRIRSRGNEWTEHGTIEDYALLRAAETVRMNCMTHFVVLDGADRTEVEENVTPAEWVKTYEEKVIDGKKTRVERRTYRPESISISIRPGQDLVVRGLVAAPGQAPEDAIAADEVLTYVGSRVKRKKDAPPPAFPACPELAFAAR
jgi:hypothetical protein